MSGRRMGLAAIAALAVALPVLATPPAGAAAYRVGQSRVAAVHVAHLSAPGIDTCLAPSTGVLRSWSDSGYHAINIYLGG
ncbi:MAG: hypothetical protein JO222_12480, partial [Frankiales bacterium]|nr:hypothetical protein [Frankiales bacterium]